MSPPADPLLDALRERFAHREFQALQRPVIEHLLGGGNALVLMPTGGGKSLCYQLPAMLQDGVTICLSPLIALMQDQVEKLRARGLPATYVNSSLDRRERERRLEQVAAGEIRLLYVTPERFRSARFLEVIERVRVPLLAVDEAHCISAWGHDFRPEYGRVGEIRRLLRDPPTVALTATATPRTQEDVRTRLRIADARLFHAGIERKNLRVGVLEAEDDDAKADRVEAVARSFHGPGIVYFALIKDLERTRERLARRGIDAAVYHGDLPASRRRGVQRAFLEADDGILLATNAFGLGVDKPDIRFILHAQLPGSLEAYVQEIGRAGRDGNDSLCALLYRSEDVLIQKQFIEWANPDADFVRGVVAQLEAWGDTLHARDVQDLRASLLIKNRSDGRPEMVLGLLRAERLVEGSFENHDLRLVRRIEPAAAAALADPGKRGRDLARLLELVQWARGDACRKRVIHAYFGFESEADWRCGSCDVCLGLDAWLEPGDARRAPGKPPTAPVPMMPARSDADAATAPVAIGDWLRIDGRHTVVVRAVSTRGTGTRIEAESAGDFRVRSYDLDRVRWEHIRD